MQPVQTRLTLVHYLFYSLPFFLGIVICIALSVHVYRGFASLGSSFVRVVMPGQARITLAKSGSYTIFHEYTSVVENEVYSVAPEALSGIRCNLNDAESGETIVLSPSASNSTYSLGSREGKSVFDFTVARGGTYEFKCFFPDEARHGLKTVLAIGQGFTMKIVSVIAMIFGIVMIFIVSASATAALIIIKLHRISQQTGEQPVVQ